MGLGIQFALRIFFSEYFFSASEGCTINSIEYTIESVEFTSFFFFFFFFILRRMGKNKALAHHTSAYFHTRRVSI